MAHSNSCPALAGYRERCNCKFLTEGKLIEIIDWLTNGNHGASSKCMLRHMLGLPDGDKYGENCYPRDHWDRERCLILLKIMPEWQSRIDEMAALNKGWAEQVELMKPGIAAMEASLDRDFKGNARAGYGVKEL